MTPFDCPSSLPRAGPRGRTSAEERTEAPGGTEVDQLCAPPACLDPAPPFLGWKGGRPVSTPSALAVWSRLSVGPCSPLGGATTPRVGQSDALSEDSASSPVTRFLLDPLSLSPTDFETLIPRGPPPTRPPNEAPGLRPESADPLLWFVSKPQPMGGHPQVTWAALGPTPRGLTPSPASATTWGGSSQASWVPGPTPVGSGIRASLTAVKAMLSLPRITS